MTYFWLWCLLGIQNPSAAYNKGARDMVMRVPPIDQPVAAGKANGNGASNVEIGQHGEYAPETGDYVYQVVGESGKREIEEAKP